MQYLSIYLSICRASQTSQVSRKAVLDHAWVLAVAESRLWDLSAPLKQDMLQSRELQGTLRNLLLVLHSLSAQD